VFKKVKETRIYESIVDQVLEAILRGDLKPGNRLPSETELGKIFGVSRVTVREAIRYLEQLGVLEVRQGSTGGAFIKEVELGSVATQMCNSLRVANVTFLHMADARAVLEHMILDRLIPPEKVNDLVKKLEENLKQAENYLKRQDNEARLRTNFDFHGIIAEMTDNPIIILMHKVIVDLSIGFFENVEPSVPMIENTLKQHRQVTELLKQNKLQEAAELCAEHIRKVSGNIVDKSNRQSVLFKKTAGKDAA